MQLRCTERKQSAKQSTKSQIIFQFHIRCPERLEIVQNKKGITKAICSYPFTATLWLPLPPYLTLTRENHPALLGNAFTNCKPKLG